MNTQAKVAISKSQHPEYYCPVPRCLWRTVVCDPMTRQMKPAENCAGGYCPRHKKADVADELAPMLRAARTARATGAWFMAALRNNGVL